MDRKLGGIALVIPALGLIGGAWWSGLVMSPVALFGLLLVFVLPAIDRVASLRDSLQHDSDRRIAALRRETIDAEILRVALKHQGRLSSAEVSAALGLDTGESQAVLEDLVQRRVASVEVPEEGMPIYAFPDAPTASTTPAAPPPAR